MLRDRHSVMSAIAFFATIAIAICCAIVLYMTNSLPSLTYSAKPSRPLSVTYTAKPSREELNRRLLQGYSTFPLGSSHQEIVEQFGEPDDRVVMKFVILCYDFYVDEPGSPRRYGEIYFHLVRNDGSLGMTTRIENGDLVERITEQR